MEILNTDASAPVTGMKTDNPPVEQEQGSYRFGLNLIEGEEGRSNEPGNIACGEIPLNYIPLGNRYTNDGRNIILLVSLNEVYSEIGIVDKNCKYTTIVNSTELGFKLNHQIDIRYRLRKGCEDVIYFTDNNRAVGYFNFSKPEDFYTEAYQRYLANPSGTFTGQKWDALKFNLFPAYEVPCFTNMEVIVGGQLRSGTFNFAIQYLDDNLNPTNFIYASQLVPIYGSSQTSDYNSIIGSSNLDVDELSGSLPTNKAIKLSLGNLDTHYKFYKIAVIESTSKNGSVTRVLLSPNIPITRTEFTYDGNIQGYTLITEEELAISKTDIEVAEHLEQIENKLILANTKGKQVNYCDFQRFASKIASTYVVREAEGSNALDVGNPKSPHTYWERQGYTGGEVYPYGIVYVFTSGLESPVCHIPGRSANKYFNVDTNQVVNSPGEDAIISVWNDDLAFIDPSSAHYNSLPADKKAKKWQVYDTAVRYSANGVSNSYGAMAYHENANVFYEPKNDCVSSDYWGVDCCGVPLVGKPIRHHKFPGRNYEPHIRSGSISNGSTGLYLDVSLLPDQVFPAEGVQTITVNYELEGVPKSQTITLDPEAFPIGKQLLDQVQGSFEDIVFISATGEVVDKDTIFAYSVYRQEIISSFVDTTIIRNFGIRFSNIEYPHPDIVGHYFVRGNRDDQNRLVLDKGYAGRLRAKSIDGQLYTTFSYFNHHFSTGEYNTDDNFLFTPRNTFNKEQLNGDYIKIDGRFDCGSQYTGSQEEDGAGSAIKEVNSVIEFRTQNYGGFDTSTGEHNFRVTDKITLDATAKDLKYNGVNSPLYNLSWSNRLNVVSTQKFLPIEGLHMNYASYNVNRNVHPIIDDIVYQRTHNCILTPANTNTVFGGDTFISRWDIANSLYSRQKKGILKALINIVLIAGAVVATVATAGAAGAALAPLIGSVIAGATAAGIASAVAVTALVAGAIGVTSTTIQAITDEIENGVLKQLTDDSDMNHATGTGIRLSAYVAYANEILYGMYVESEVNVALTQEQRHVCGTTFRFQTSIYEYFRSRWLYFDPDTGKWTAKGFVCPETYDYNKDYSRENEQSKYFALPSTYNCCSDCKESHPNRVHYSEESFQEEQTDNYRIFKPNNYRDIEAEHGRITGIIKRNNNLFIQTSEALWILPQSTQERVTNEIVTFIGTGEFFGLPPKKITDSEIGTAGTQHKWANLNTDKGLLFVNEIESRVYLYDRNFEDISKLGRMYWFKDNLNDYFARQFKLITGVDFPNQNNPANPFGIGIHSTYDSYRNRVLITKRDYLLLPQFVAGFKIVSSVNGLMPVSLASGAFAFDMTSRKFVLGGSSPAVYQFIDFNNTTYFESKSFTTSFSLNDKYKSWTSMHSYTPNYYIYTHNELYSLVSGSNKIWRHNEEGIYNNYYGTQYPHIIEHVLVNDKLITKSWVDLQLQTTARVFDLDSRQFVERRDITFNKITAYNERQSTGEMTIQFKNTQSEEDYMFDQVVETPGIMLADRNERDWTLNDFRDFILDPAQPLFLRNWMGIRQAYYIDKVVNQVNIDYNKDWTQLESLTDKYLIVRLKFDNFTNTQLITHYLVDTKGTSFR